jgi:hypothetical protein
MTLLEGVSQAMFLSPGKTVLLLVSTGLAQTPALAQGKDIVKAGAAADLPPEARQALERNARALAPIALTLEKQRSAPQPPTELTRKLLGVNPGILKPCTYEYLRRNGLCYARFNQWLQGGRRIGDTENFTSELMESWQEYSWDGNCAYVGAPSLQPQLLSIVPLEKLATDAQFKHVSWYGADDYLALIGITVPRKMTELTEAPRSEVLSLLESGGRLMTARAERLAEGPEHLVIELLLGGKKHRFWLDPSRGHAVRRQEVWAESGALAVAVDNSDFVQLTGPDLWLPRHCHAEWHSWLWWPKEITPETSLVVDIQATRLERTEVPPAKFTLKYDKPGSYISDARLPGAEKTKRGRIDYLVSPGLVNVQEAGPTALPGKGQLSLWVGGGVLLLVAITAVLALLRRRRQA